MSAGDWNGTIRPIDHVLERIMVANRELFDDEWAAVWGEAEIAQWRMEAFARMAYELRSYVLAERLEPDVQRVNFTRRVPVTDTEQRLWRQIAPASRWDAIKLFVLPGWLRRRLKPAKRKGVNAWTACSYHGREATVHVEEQVRIERAFTFPGATVRFPKELGKPVYREWRSQ